MKHFVLAALFAAAVSARLADNANTNYRTKEGRENMGRGLGSPDRDQRQKPAELVAAMKLAPGMTVADLGTGVGYMPPYLSRAVGPSGRVIAEDIFPDFIEQAKAAAQKAGLSNITWVLGTDRDPQLPEGAADVVLALDVYHHFDYPEPMVAAIAKALKPGGRLVLVEYHKTAARLAPGHVRLDQAGTIKEIEAGGFELIESRDHIPQEQYLATFRRK